VPRGLNALFRDETRRTPKNNSLTPTFQVLYKHGENLSTITSSLVTTDDDVVLPDKFGQELQSCTGQWKAGLDDSRTRINMKKTKYMGSST